MKKIFTFMCAVLFVGILFSFIGTPSASAQPCDPKVGPCQPTGGFTALAPIPGLTDPSATSVVNSTTLADFLNNLYKYLIGVAAALAVIMIIWSGIRIAYNRDNVSAITDSKGHIAQALLGLVLVLAPVLIFSIINPSILNLSLNLPELNTAPGVTRSASSEKGTADATTGCTLIGAPNILQIAGCPSNASVQKETDRCGAAGGKVSVVSQNTLTDGTITSSILVCEWSNKYVFIDTSDSGIIGFVTSSLNTINNVQPLAIASTNQNNGASVMQFASTCSASGMSTCISDPSFASADECTPTPKTPLPGAARKCGSLTLTCRYYGSAHTVIASLCSKSPSWTPFQ